MTHLWCHVFYFSAPSMKDLFSSVSMLILQVLIFFSLIAVLYHEWFWSALFLHCFAVTTTPQQASCAFTRHHVVRCTQQSDHKMCFLFTALWTSFFSLKKPFRICHYLSCLSILLFFLYLVAIKVFLIFETMTLLLCIMYIEGIWIVIECRYLGIFIINVLC